MPGKAEKNCIYKNLLVYYLQYYLDPKKGVNYG